MHLEIYNDFNKKQSGRTSEYTITPHPTPLSHISATFSKELNSLRALAANCRLISPGGGGSRDSPPPDTKAWGLSSTTTSGVLASMLLLLTASYNPTSNISLWKLCPIRTSSCMSQRYRSVLLKMFGFCWIEQMTSAFFVVYSIHFFFEGGGGKLNFPPSFDWWKIQTTKKYS